MGAMLTFPMGSFWHWVSHSPEAVAHEPDAKPAEFPDARPGQYGGWGHPCDKCGNFNDSEWNIYEHITVMHDDQEWNLNEYIYIYTHFDHIEVRFTQALTILAEF